MTTTDNASSSMSRYQQAMQEVEQQEPFDPNKVYEQWQTSKKPILDIIMAGQKKPEPTLTPEDEQKARFGSALGDTFGSLAEMFAHGQGARVRNREGKSSVQNTNERLQALRDKYDAADATYRGVEANANLQDFTGYLSNAMKARNEKREFKLNVAAQEAKQAELERQAQLLAAKQAAEDKRHADKMAEDKRQFDKRLSLDWYKAQKESKAQAEKEKKEKVIPIFLKGKEREFPAKFMDDVVSRAIRDGLAGEITETHSDITGRTTVKRPVTATTKLDDNQKRQIFEKVYRNYVYEDEKGNILTRQKLTPYDKKSGISAQDKWEGNTSRGTAAPAADPLGLFD